ECSFGRRALDGVAIDARGGEKDRTPCRRLRVFRRRSSLRRNPTGELFGGMRDDAKAHFRVLRPAILGAIAEIRGRTLPLYPHPVDAVGDQVGLPRELRDPETMYDVIRFECQGCDLTPARFADRDVQLVRRDDAQIGIAKLPPPLTPDGRHLQRVWRLGVIL